MENPEITADVINFLTNSERLTEALKGERGVPISSVVTEAVNGVVDECTGRINAYVAEVAKVAAEIDPPFPPASAEIGKMISDLADAVRYQEITRKKRLIASMSRQQSFFKKVRQNNSDSCKGAGGQEVAQ